MPSRLLAAKKCEFFIIYVHRKHCVSSNYFHLLFFLRNTKSEFPMFIEIGNTSKRPVQFILRHWKRISKSWCRVFNFICNRNRLLKAIVTAKYLGNLTWHKQTDVNAKLNVPKLSKIVTTTVQEKKIECQKICSSEMYNTIHRSFECVCTRFCSQRSIDVVFFWHNENIHGLFLLLSYVQGINLIVNINLNASHPKWLIKLKLIQPLWKCMKIMTIPNKTPNIC